ncbi:MAG: SpoIIE family protein phosphatase [Oscillospiraceae bacterium]|nr:SpoIIE family protein phosphatase [Oscillospiraceae bacterium]
MAGLLCDLPQGCGKGQCVLYDGADGDGGLSLYHYTDGVPEAGGTRSNMYGTERMLKTLNSCPDAGPEELLKKIRADVDAFAGTEPQFDDLTMLCLRYNGPGSKEKQNGNG